MTISPSTNSLSWRLGITGGIATGKSSVAKILSSQHSLLILDADQLAKEVLADGSEACLAVLERFGEEVRSNNTASESKCLDRKALARVIFQNTKEKHWLEQLVHPMVREGLQHALNANDSVAIVVLMIPLLFEAGMQDLCDEIWLVECDESQQLERLMSRDGLSRTAARTRIDNQWPLARKRDLADVLINNSHSFDSLVEEVSQAIATTHLRLRQESCSPV